MLLFKKYDTVQDGVRTIEELGTNSQDQLKPIIFSRVAWALDWIRETINNTGKFCPRP